jgi:hypothetical protein
MRKQKTEQDARRTRSQSRGRENVADVNRANNLKQQKQRAASKEKQHQAAAQAQKMHTNAAKNKVSDSRRAHITQAKQQAKQHKAAQHSKKNNVHTKAQAQKKRGNQPRRGRK